MNRRIAIGTMAVLGAAALAVAILPPFGVTAREDVPRFEGHTPDLPVPGEGTGQLLDIGDIDVTSHEDAPGEGNLLPESPFPRHTEDLTVFRAPGEGSIWPVAPIPERTSVIRAPGEGNLLPVSPFPPETKVDDSGTMDFE